MLKVDFHTHTHYSKDSLTAIPDLIRAAWNRGLDRVVVTDHNSLRGALEARDMAPELVITGEEVQTTEGEFLAAYVTRELPRGLEPMEALRRLKDQGAFISLSHPFDPRRSGWSLETLMKLVPQVDAIEVLNARCLNNIFNEKAVAFAQEKGLPGTAGSDAHHPSEIGQVYSLVPDFSDAASLRAAIHEGTHVGEISSPGVLFYTFWARVVKSFRRSQSWK